jgi:hypothetical protein
MAVWWRGRRKRAVENVRLRGGWGVTAASRGSAASRGAAARRLQACNECNCKRAEAIVRAAVSVLRRFCKGERRCSAEAAASVWWRAEVRCCLHRRAAASGGAAARRLLACGGEWRCDAAAACSCPRIRSCTFVAAQQLATACLQPPFSTSARRCKLLPPRHRTPTRRPWPGRRRTGGERMCCYKRPQACGGEWRCGGKVCRFG